MIRLGMLTGFERRISQFESLGIEPGDTVFLGDSLTEFGEWSELFPNSSVRNRGIDGDQTAGVLTRLHQIIQGTPRQVFLLIGTNDLTGGVPEKQIVRNVTTIVERIRIESPHTEIFVQSVLPRSEDYTAQVDSLNAAIRDAVVDQARWIDLYPLFLDEEGTSIDDALSTDDYNR